MKGSQNETYRKNFPLRNEIQPVMRTTVDSGLNPCEHLPVKALFPKDINAFKRMEKRKGQEIKSVQIIFFEIFMGELKKDSLHRKFFSNEIRSKKLLPPRSEPEKTTSTQTFIIKTNGRPTSLSYYDVISPSPSKRGLLPAVSPHASSHVSRSNPEIFSPYSSMIGSFSTTEKAQRTLRLHFVTYFSTS